MLHHLAEENHMQGLLSAKRRTAAILESLEGRTLFAATLFQIDPVLSKIRLDGEAFSIDLDEQDDGSLQAHYEGIIKADVTGNTIDFLDGSNIVAQSYGNFSPGDLAANYAGEAEGPFGINLGKVAIRGLTLDLTSGSITLANGAFDSKAAHFEIKTGTADYDTNDAGDGSEDLSGNGGDNRTSAQSTLGVNADGLTTLTIPINVKLDENNLEVTLSGKLVAVSLGTAPVVDLNGPDAAGRDFVAPFVVHQDSAVAAADPGVTVTDADDTKLNSGTITIGNRLDGASERLSVTTGGTGITSSFNSTTGILTLSGNQTLANYRTVLASLRYHNDAATPTVGDRAITVVLNDGTDDGPAATSTISVTDPNVASLGTGGSKAVFFTDIDGSIVSISLKGGGSASLQFSGATTQVEGKKGATLTGTNVTLASIQLTDPSVKSKLSIKAVGGTDGGTTITSITSNAPLASIGSKTTDLAGTVNIAGFLGRADFRNVTGSTISADAIGRLTVYGAMTNSTVALDASFVPLIPVLGRFTVNGVMSGSKVTTAGSIGRVTIGSMVASQIYPGRSGTDAFPNALADFTVDDVLIGRVALGSKKVAGPAFDGSVIAARSMGKVGLGLVDTDNGAVPFGVTADNIASLSATNATGQVLKLKNLDDPTAASAAIVASGFSTGDLQIRVV
jgi:hypothetical protein